MAMYFDHSLIFAYAMQVLFSSAKPKTWAINVAIRKAIDFKMLIRPHLFECYGCYQND